MSVLLRIVSVVAALLFAGSAAAQTLACHPASPRTDPGTGFVPFGANEQALARGGNAGPAWEWALGTDTGAGQMVKGSLDWVSGRVYGWTLIYSGTGSATLEVRDAGALVLSLSYPSGMDTGNALELRVSTNPSIGASTTIAASASSLKGQAVSGSISQTGNNQESVQRLYFYYPPMAQGFTATGTVTLTYASLPTGSRVDFKVRAGTIPCSNLAPTVSLTTPAAESIHQAGSAISVSANAADADGIVQSVGFLANGSLIGTDTTSPYAISWTGAAPGSYSLTARATDNAGDQTLSAAVSIIVNAQPTVSITSPASGTVVQAPGTVNLAASASDPDGTVTKVEFYRDGNLVASDTSSPYEAGVSGLAAGTYSFTAVATDDRGGTATSAAVTVIVNAAPTVSITAPANGATFTAPGAVNITAAANDPDGTIGRVELYANATLIATLTAPPYSFSWTNVAAGTYALTAKALDNNNAETVSAPVTITVQQQAATLYFIHADHLNTPRAVYDDQQQLRWGWDQAEPFGDNPADENPSSLGTFEFPLRRAGEYADKETGDFYNYFRTLDPAIDRLACSRMPSTACVRRSSVVLPVRSAAQTRLRGTRRGRAFLISRRSASIS